MFSKTQITPVLSQMKKAVLSILALMLIFSLTACGAPADDTGSVQEIAQPQATDESPESQSEAVPDDVESEAPSFIFGNLVVAYPDGAEIDVSQDEAAIYLAGKEVDTNAAIQIQLAKETSEAPIGEYIENGSIVEIIAASMKDQAGVSVTTEPKIISLLDGKAVYASFQASMNDRTFMMRQWSFSDGTYVYTIFSSIHESLNADYDTWVSQIIERLSWENGVNPRNYGAFENDQLSFYYPKRYVQWSLSTRNDPDVIALLKENIDAYSDEAMEGLLGQHEAFLYDFESKSNGYTPFMNFQISDIPGGDMTYFTKGTGAADYEKIIEAQYGGTAWQQKPMVERAGDTEFVVCRFAYTDGSSAYTYFIALHVWDEKMITICSGVPTQAMTETYRVEFYELLASMKFK